MATDFDKVINRKGTHSLKYDFATVRGKKADILPLWVADMDFQAPKAVRERLFEIVEHGIFGYSDTLEDYFRAVKSWYKRRFDWEIKSNWIIKTPGIVFALASGTVLAIEQLSESSDNKERYRILGQLGASKPMVNRCLLVQIGITFMFPLIVALIHSFVALKEINYIISLMVSINIADNILVTTIFIVIVYGGYYLATYLASNRIINE